MRIDSGDDSTQPEVLAKLVLLRQSYISGLPEKLQAIEVLWDQLIHREWRRETLDELHLRVHSLCGSGATFGLDEISTSARRLEQELNSLCAMGAPSPGNHVTLAKWMQDLAQVMRDVVDAPMLPLNIPYMDGEKGYRENTTQAGSFSRQNETDTDQQRVPVVYLAEDEAELSALVCLYLRQQGYEVRAFDSPTALVKAAKKQPPDVIVSDIVFPEGENAGLESLASLKAETSIPLIFTSARIDLSARIQALRAGADAYLTKPLDLGALAGKLRELTLDLSTDPYRVLVVDDEEEVARLHASVLQTAGIRCEILLDPMGIMKPLLEFCPELILADLHMPGMNGFELARLIRLEESFLNTPIVFLSSDTRDANAIESISIGADHFLHKPIDPVNLVSAVEGRVRRARAVNRRMEYLARRDPTTGIFNRANFSQELGRMILNTLSGSSGLVCILIDNYLSLRDLLSKQELNALIAETAGAVRKILASGDLVGRYSDLTLMVHIVRSCEKDIESFAEKIRQALSQLTLKVGKNKVQITCSIGVQLVRNQSAVALMEGASQAATRAYQAGGNSVQIDGETEILLEQQARRNSRARQPGYCRIRGEIISTGLFMDDQCGLYSGEHSAIAGRRDDL